MKRRNDKRTKTPSWFANRKVYLLLHLLVVVEKRETSYENWVDRVSEAKTNEMLWGESRHRRWIILFVFCVSYNTYLLTRFVIATSLEVWDPFRNSLDAAIFSRLYIVAHRSQFTLFLFLTPRPLLTAFEFDTPPDNQSQQPISLDTFLSLTRAPAAVMIWISGTYLSLSCSFLLFHICSFLFYRPVVDQ